jgi:hypothetical protein
MANYFKRYERFAFVILLLLTVASAIMGVWCVLRSLPAAAKWIGTSGLLATVTGVVQLEVSGLFEKILTHYGDDEKYPYGPPSYITREIIDNPDRPFSTWLRNTCYFNAGTGFWLIVLGTMTQVVAVWV